MGTITINILMVVSIVLSALLGFASLGLARNPNSGVRHQITTARQQLNEMREQLKPAHARLSSVLGKRCEDTQELTPAQCVQTREDAFKSGCIGKWERQIAASNAWSVFCVGRRIILVCPCSCFDASTKIMAHGSSAPQWLEAADISVDDKLVTLNASATISTLDQSESWGIRNLRWITSGPEENDMFVFNLSTGRELSITQNHAVLLYSGVVKAAKDINATDQFVDAKGARVEIVEIYRRPAEDGNVYNFLVDTDEPQGHLVLAEGVMVGDSIWQDHFGELLDKIFIRK